MKTTPNYGLKKPERNEYVNIEDINFNADKIDTTLKENADAVAGKYSKPPTGIPKADLNESVQNSLNKADSAIQTIPAIPDATLDQKGIVQLNNNTNSTSTTQAATPRAVKTAYDKAVSVEQAQGTHNEDNVKHVTADERTAWNGKQNVLPIEQKRRIFIQSTAPTNPQDGDIWIEV